MGLYLTYVIVYDLADLLLLNLTMRMFFIWTIHAICKYLLVRNMCFWEGRRNSGLDK